MLCLSAFELYSLWVPLKQLKKEDKGNRPNAAEALSDDEMNIFYEKKLPGNFKRRSIDKHTLALQFTAFWSTRMWRASAYVLGRWNWIFTFFLKDKLKPEVELIHVMSDRSNLKLSRLQIYRANEILLLFSRSILKRDQSPWTNQMHPFI